MRIRLPALVGDEIYASEKKRCDGFNTGVLNPEAFMDSCLLSVVMVERLLISL